MPRGRAERLCLPSSDSPTRELTQGRARQRQAAIKWDTCLAAHAPERDHDDRETEAGKYQESHRSRRWEKPRRLPRQCACARAMTSGIGKQK